jgi:YVTN family beta-propeller protein
MPGVSGVSAAAAPSPYSDLRQATGSLDSIKATAVQGTPATSGPSANIGQALKLRGSGLQPGVASFPGYNGTPVTSPLTNVKAGKKGKAVVPQLAVSGPVTVVPDGGEPTNGLQLQIVPTANPLNPRTVTPGAQITITGTGFAPGAQVQFPGVAAAVTPDTLDQDTAVVTVPEGVQKGKVTVTTAGGTSNTIKIKVAAGRANKALATDPVDGLILVADDTANTLSALDPETGHVIRSVRVVDEPTRVVVSSDPHRATVLNDEGRSTVVDLDTWAVRPARRGSLPAVIAMQSHEPTLDVRNVLRAPAASSFRWRLELGPATETVVTTPDGSRALVLAGDDATVYVVDLATGSVARVLRFDGPLEGVTIGTDGRGYTTDRATGQLLAFPVD